MLFEELLEVVTVPLASETQPLFAFTYRGCQFTWTHLPQGFVDSPAVFSTVVHRTLADIHLPETTCILQYADDILVTGLTEQDCHKASVIVCNVLAQAGFKASHQKLQWVKRKVSYLGHVISEGQRKISQDRVQLVTRFSRPQTVKQMQTFLGLVNYCRAWIPDYAQHNKVLRSAIDHKAPPSHLILWTHEMTDSFAALKKAIQSAPALGLPNNAKPFHLYVHEHLLCNLYACFSSRWNEIRFFFDLSTKLHTLFESGYSIDILYLNDPTCKGTLQNGRLVLNYGSASKTCGTSLQNNGTHFIFKNRVGTIGGISVISRANGLNLTFSYNCWATPFNQSDSSTRWDLIIKECPSPYDGTVKVFQNGVSTSSHFSFRMFTFTGFSNKIYLHCKVHLCLKKSENCALVLESDASELGYGTVSYLLMENRKDPDIYAETTTAASPFFDVGSNPIPLYLDDGAYETIQLEQPFKYDFIIPSRLDLRRRKPLFHPDELRKRSSYFLWFMADAIETCSGSAGLLSLSRCQLFEAGYSEDVLHLNDPSCKGKVYNGRLVFNFDSTDNLCSTTLTSNNTHIIFKNNVGMIDGIGVISRSGGLNIAISCVYPLIRSISMPTDIQASGSVLSKDLSTEGSYQISIIPYTDATFLVPISGKVTLEVNHQMYIGVKVDRFDSTQIALVLDRCPNPNDGTVAVLQNGVSTSSNFSFRMFTFTGFSNKIFLHCQVHLCLQESGNCARVRSDGMARQSRPEYEYSARTGFRNNFHK
ncbi:hypothetical protein C0J45_6497 [Silurus meridionalis]|nr:hypothetical protein C0J45_6497 [Silurus meridionalis]